MKKRYIIPVIVLLLLLGAYHFWGPKCIASYYMYKFDKICPDSRSFLDNVPEPVVLKLHPTHAINSEYTSFTQGVYRVSLLGAFRIEKSGSVTKLNGNDVKVMTLGGTDDSEASDIADSIGAPNAFSAFSSIYKTTFSAIRELATYDSIKHEIVKLTIKNTLLFGKSDEYFAEFDRTDFKGFISGDIGRGSCFIEIFSDQGDHVMNILCTSENESTKVEAIYDLLRSLQIKKGNNPNQGMDLTRNDAQSIVP